MFCQNCSYFETPTTKCPLNENESVCTVSTQESSSSWSIPSISSRNYNSSFYVTGQHTDIFNEYDILPQILGSGNYGCVRECIRRSTGKKFAVKTIEKSTVHHIDHLRQEIETLCTIKHRSIINLIDIYEDSDFLHIVTDKYTGGELYDKIINSTTRTGCLSELEAARIIKSILEAVSYLHANGIVHRDIKPENILFESTEEGSPVRLIDFGLSCRHQYGEKPMNNSVGTAYYMSPDVLNGSYDRSCDLWSIGVVAYILLCGYPPFNGCDDAHIAASVLQGNLSFPRSVWSGMSNVSVDFIRKLLCRDSSIRYTAEEALQHPWIVCHSLSSW